jgi:hypothetical protein
MISIITPVAEARWMAGNINSKSGNNRGFLAAIAILRLSPAIAPT